MYRKVEAQQLSRSQFDSARLGYFQLLRRKRMSPQFVDRHGEDLFAQACYEYSRRVAEGVEIHDPPAWIVTCGWNRTKSLLESRDYRPQIVSTESVAEPIDARPDPADALLDQDRARKIREAVLQLPHYQRQLLALSYFEGESVREAGRRLHWTASKAQRAHEAAQKRIVSFLEVSFGATSNDELTVVGLFAFLSVCADRTSGHFIPAGVEAVLDPAQRGASAFLRKADTMLHRRVVSPGDTTRFLDTRRTGAVKPSGHGRLGKASELGRRLLLGGGGEAGAVIGSEGSVRALEACKGLAVCLIGATALVGAVHRPPELHPPRPGKVSSSRRPGVASLSRSELSGTTTEALSHRVSGSSRRSSTAESEVSETDEVIPAITTKAAQLKREEAQAVAQFQNFDATEASTQAKSGSPTSAATPNASPPPTGSTNERRNPEEAGVAKEFRGPLE